MAKVKTLEDLFLDTLKDIYYAERKILKALPKMKRAATNEKLAAAFDKHLGETEGQSGLGCGPDLVRSSRRAL